MANKKKTTKRRVAAVRQEERRQAATRRQDRRRKLIIGGMVAFLALALIAPLTAGLIGSGSSTSSTTTLPPITAPEPIDLPWVAPEFEGISLTGATPCPADDGSEDRTTGFELAPPTCITDGETFDLTFDSAAGSFTVPVDSALDLDAANLAVVFGRYHTYEQTPISSVPGGLLWIGSPGDTGFTIPATPPAVGSDNLYPIGSVVALADVDGTLSGTLMVVLEETGSILLQATPRHVVIGNIADLTDAQAVFDAPASDEILLIDATTVTTTS